MSARRLYLVEYTAILLGVGLVGMLVLPFFARARESDGPYGRCPSNIKQIGLVVAQYAADYNGFLPSVQGKGTMFGWADALLPYTKTRYVFQCPAQVDRMQDNPGSRGYTDYWFNARVAGHMLAGVSMPTQTLLLGDGNDGTDVTDARYSLSSLPPAWKTDEKSPLFRHLGTANYVFADGHAKMFPAGAITNSSRFRF
ncbi:hypothetical protein IAD21_03577 [Abditibacteriota bacterium]|nr:hypothetical protein IAD21_03577 [Abditibacteriota bacterium]